MTKFLRVVITLLVTCLVTLIEVTIMDWGIFKRHPYMTAIGALGVIAIVWFATSGSSSGSTAATTTGPTAADLQLAQLSAAQNQTQMQTSAAIQVANIQAGVQQNQIAAQQETTDNQTAAQLAAYQAAQATQLAAYGAQVDINAANVQGQTQQTQAMANVIMDQYNQQTAQQANVVNYLNNLTNAQASVANNTITAQTTLASQQLTNQQQATQYQYNLDQSTIANIKNVGGSQNRTSILLGAQGNQQGAIAAEYGQTASSISGDTLLSNIGKASAGALASLFG